jgi:hypothetical protein
MPCAAAWRPCAVNHSAPYWVSCKFSPAYWEIPPTVMPMDLSLMLVTALGCASIGWAVTHFVSRSLAGPDTGRSSFVSSASAAEPDGHKEKRTRRRRFSTAARAHGLTEGGDKDR